MADWRSVLGQLLLLRPPRRRRYPYCVEHARVAYQPSQKTKKRDTGTDLSRSLRRYL
ncbi:gcrA cell cycle regulator [Asticcacaulis biprosthecium C19]|uniref:GcrA cell cycle regulator n=1 Tax=Asticcacaulis biprosthecium C19 TaxID=715226 RepID=F4QG81_9CAUL|nr:gcrA cell cycle regulator [Asticcacaulis biprosthecium C19]